MQEAAASLHTGSQKARAKDFSLMQVKRMQLIACFIVLMCESTDVVLAWPK